MNMEILTMEQKGGRNEAAATVSLSPTQDEQETTITEASSQGRHASHTAGSHSSHPSSSDNGRNEVVGSQRRHRGQKDDGLEPVLLPRRPRHQQEGESSADPSTESTSPIKKLVVRYHDSDKTSQRNNADADDAVPYLSTSTTTTDLASPPPFQRPYQPRQPGAFYVNGPVGSDSNSNSNTEEEDVVVPNAYVVESESMVAQRLQEQVDERVDERVMEILETGGLLPSSAGDSTSSWPLPIPMTENSMLDPAMPIPLGTDEVDNGGDDDDDEKKNTDRSNRHLLNITDKCCSHKRSMLLAGGLVLILLAAGVTIAVLVTRTGTSAPREEGIQENPLVDMKEWAQMGQDIDGEATNDRFGRSVALSFNGTILAAGGTGNDGQASRAGHVRVFSYNSTASEWLQMGQDVDGEAGGDRFGISVALSADGTVLAAGGYYNRGNGYRSGHVRVYSYSFHTSEWVQMGQDLDGEKTGENFGFSVALSSNGTVVAIGGTGNDHGNGINSGHVRVYSYRYDTSQWVQMGQDLDGEAEIDMFGFSVALSADGTIMASGGPYNDGKNRSDSGHVRMYSYSTDTSQWVQMGDEVYGEEAGDEFGRSVALSADGRVMAAGGSGNDGTGDHSGCVRVYSYEATTFQWVQMGQDVYGEAAGDNFGDSLALSSDGRFMAAGGPQNSDKGDGSGHVRLYSYNSSTSTSHWQQLGQDVDGEEPGDTFGGAVALSADGTVFAAGGRKNDGNGNDSGHVRVFEAK